MPSTVLLQHVQQSIKNIIHKEASCRKRCVHWITRGGVFTGTRIQRIL